MDLNKVKSVAIYPSIGIARVGNSPNEYFIGPIIPGVTAQDPDDFRDAQGRIKRQAAEFRIFGLDDKGNVLGELNESHDVAIDWKVDVANKKAAWYQFDIALDIPAAEGYYDVNGNAQNPRGLPTLCQKRNLYYDGSRKELMIEATARRISGKNTNQKGTGKGYIFEGQIGKKQTDVYLGEVRTDEEGRLLFLGGRGHSASFEDKPLTTFANNEGWHDDTSDGPVDASVSWGEGKNKVTMEAAGAWVVVAPPNYAVGVQAFTTGYELLQDVQYRNGTHKPNKTSFYKNVYPTLQHLTQNQWVNAGVSREFGWGSAYEFDNEALLEKLNDKSEKNRPFRQTILECFRDPTYTEMQAEAWPPLYGDAVTFNMNSTDPRNWYAVTELQYLHLKNWALGDFDEDQPIQPKKWDDMSPVEQANGLTEAALEETLGGPFHPGCEFTWPMRNAIIFDDKDPWRIKRRKNVKDDFGVALDSSIALGEGGPLDGSSPGDITRWMAVPWQSDTSSCLSAYRAYAGEYLPTFWPARVPNDVLTEKDYKTIQNPKTPKEKKIKAFSPSSRRKWLRGYIFTEDGQFIGGNSISERMKGVTKFTEEWYKIGIILKKPLKSDTDLFPKEVWVESGRSIDEDQKRGLLKSSQVESTKRPDWVDVNPRKLR